MNEESERELLNDAASNYGLHVYDGETEELKKVNELHRNKLISLEEYNVPVAVYRITKRGKEYLREIKV
jgi:hypothetical protein